MKKLVTNKKAQIVLLGFILLLATILRFNQLGNMPFGITNDEASYIYSAYSIWETGKDIPGNFLPLSLNLGSSLSPVPVYLTAPFVGLLGASPFAGRLPFALLSFATVFVVYLLAKQLFQNKAIALLSAFVLAVSPWHLHIGRTAYDGVIALFFFCLGTYIFFRMVEKGSTLWSLPFFLFAFYSYHGTKVFFVFYIPLLLILHREYFWKKKRELLLFVSGILLILGSFYVVMKTQSVTRQGVFIWNDPAPAVRHVNYEREKNTAPFILREVMNNKPLYYLRSIRENYLHAFSTDFLFLYGDSTGVYHPFFRGEMYFFEVIFLLWGAAFLLSYKEKRVRNFLFIALILAPLPSAFTTDRNYVVRSIMMLPFLAIITGCGLYACGLALRRFVPVLRFGFITGIVLLYGVFLLSYLYQYYYRYNVYGAEDWFRSHREVVEYMQKEQGNYDRVLISTPNREFILQYGVLMNIDPRVIQSLWQDESERTIGKITFLPGCIDDSKKPLDPQTDLPENTLYITESECHKDSPTKTVLLDYGEPLRSRWRIFENK